MDLWDHNRRSKILAIRVLEGEKEDKTENVLKEIMKFSEIWQKM